MRSTIMLSKRLVISSVCAGALFFAASSSTAATICETTTDAGADQTINICDTAVDRTINAANTTADGTVFVAEEMPSSPSTGTGVFEPFVRIHEPSADTSQGGDGLELGFNTDTGNPDINFDTKNGSNWTTATMVGDLTGATSMEFLLDANQEGPVGTVDNLIWLTDVQIYICKDAMGVSCATPEDLVSADLITDTGYTGVPFDSTSNSLLGEAPRWSLDNATNGDVTVVLEAAICGSPGTVPGQCGSGHGDMVMSIPLSAIDLTGVSADDYLVFYSEYMYANDGSEEWKRDVQPIPEPGAALVFSLGLLFVGRHLGIRKR
jgi:hypothetical protein